MKNKLLALAMAAAIALVAVPLAVAAGGPAGNSMKPMAKNKPFLAKGTVVSVETSTTTMVVKVTKGSRNMRSLKGEEVMFTLATRSHMFARTVGRHHGKFHYKHATLEQVTAGSRVTINGRIVRSADEPVVYLARHIVVKLAPVETPSPAPVVVPAL